MNKEIVNRYVPESVSAPGDTLEEMLEAAGLSQAELAERTGRSKKLINEIVKGIAPITSETALQLERVLGMPAHFWNQREQNYRDFKARQNEREKIQKDIGWLKELPVAAMVKRRWIEPRTDKTEQLQELLNFFGVASVPAWRSLWGERQLAQFRASATFSSKAGAVAAWIRQGDMVAQHIDCMPYSSPKFRSALDQIRDLTLSDPAHFQIEIQRICAAAGVAVVFVPEMPGSRVHGATRWVSPIKAIIQVCLRDKSDDHFWFTLFHEAGHVLLHRKSKLFLEGDEGAVPQEEVEANTFAANRLIPPDSWRQFVKGRPLDRPEIQAFAQSIGIAPGIVVGRLQKDGILPFSHCNDLKRSLQWTDSDEIVLVA